MSDDGDKPGRLPAVANCALEEGRLAGRGTSRSAKHSTPRPTGGNDVQTRPRSSSAALAVAALALAGCASSSKTTSTTASIDRPRRRRDVPGHPDGTTVAAKPTHIISLSPTATDMLFSIGAGPQVIAVDKNSDYFGAQAPAQTPPANLDAYKPNAEAIAAKSPDLVVIASDTDKIQEQLTALKIPVYVAAAAVTLDDTYKQETALGALTDNVAGATKVVADEKAAITAELANLPKRTKPLTLLLRARPDASTR